MLKTNRFVTVASTVLLGAAVAASFVLPPIAQPAAAASTRLVAMGNKYAATTCARCHGPNFAGKPGRTPNITPAGKLKEYNQVQFERLLATGIKNDGKHLKHMPVLHYTASKSDAIYAYLKTL